MAAFFRSAVLAVSDDAARLQEIVRIQRRREPGRGVGRQDVVGTGPVVADGFGRIGADENGARVAHRFDQFPGVLRVQAEMLRARAG